MSDERRGRLQEGYRPEGKAMKPRPTDQRPSAPPRKPSDAHAAAKPPAKDR